MKLNYLMSLYLITIFNCIWDDVNMGYKAISYLCNNNISIYSSKSIPPVRITETYIHNIVNSFTILALSIYK